MNVEITKYAPLEIKYRFLELLNMCWKTYRIPEGIIYPIFKKGNRRECGNYRGINLLNSAYKIYAKLLTKRINIINEVLLIEEHCGFRRGHSCSDCVFILQQLIQKGREFNLATYFLFIDYKKAFDTVTRGKL